MLLTYPTRQFRSIAAGEPGYYVHQATDFKKKILARLEGEDHTVVYLRTITQPKLLS